MWGYDEDFSSNWDAKSNSDLQSSDNESLDDLEVALYSHVHHQGNTDAEQLPTKPYVHLLELPNQIKDNAQFNNNYIWDEKCGSIDVVHNDVMGQEYQGNTCNQTPVVYSDDGNNTVTENRNTVSEGSIRIFNIFENPKDNIQINKKVDVPFIRKPNMTIPGTSNVNKKCRVKEIFREEERKDESKYNISVQKTHLVSPVVIDINDSSDDSISSLSPVKPVAPDVVILDSSGDERNTYTDKKCGDTNLKGHLKNVQLESILQERDGITDEDITVLRENVRKKKKPMGKKKFYRTIGKKRDSSIEVKTHTGSLTNETEDIVINVHNPENVPSPASAQCLGRKRKKGIVETRKKTESSSVSCREPANSSVPLCKSWTLEMSEFYDHTWGGENFNVAELQKSMSDTASWNIDSTDRMFFPQHLRQRYFRPKDQCRKCQEFGHFAANCTKQSQKIYCYMCGEEGHRETRCEKKMCLTCGSPTSLYSSACPSCRRMLTTETCDICRLIGHSSDFCPDLWRRYHVTVTPGEVVAPDMVMYKMQKKAFCSNCSYKGHFNYQCRNYRYSQYHRAVPHVVSYEEEVEHQQRRKTSARNDGASNMTSARNDGANNMTSTRNDHDNNRKTSQFMHTMESQGKSRHTSWLSVKEFEKLQYAGEDVLGQIQERTGVSLELFTNGWTPHIQFKGRKERQLEAQRLLKDWFRNKISLTSTSEVKEGGALSLRNVLTKLSSDGIAKPRTNPNSELTTPKCTAESEPSNDDVSLENSTKSQADCLLPVLKETETFKHLSTIVNRNMFNDNDSSHIPGKDLSNKRCSLIVQIKRAISKLKYLCTNVKSLFRQVRAFNISQTSKPNCTSKKLKGYIRKLKMLNMTLLGQCQLDPGPYHLEKLEEEVSNLELSKERVVPYERKERIGVHYDAIFTGYLRDDLVELVQLYHTAKKKKNGFSGRSFFLNSKNSQVSGGSGRGNFQQLSEQMSEKQQIKSNSNAQSYNVQKKMMFRLIYKTLYEQRQNETGAKRRLQTQLSLLIKKVKQGDFQPKDMQRALDIIQHFKE